MLNLFKRMFDVNARDVRELEARLAAVSALAPEAEKAADDELLARTAEFRNRVDRGESVDSLLPEAFATVREVARRKLGLYPYDVQVMGGMVLHQGKIAEMKTGEGKTLVATMPAYLNALEGRGVHIITVNDYLARRDAEWMGPVYQALGLDVGVILHDLDAPARRRAYGSDITYGTNNEFGFDYLRDNMATSADQQVQRGHNYAIVDEVDSILIDEARTPLIISGQAEESTEKYFVFARIADSLKQEQDYTVDEKANSVALTESGVSRVERWLGVDNLFDEANIELTHHINAALRAKALMRRDRDYIVKEDEVIIVDEFTGRLMFGRRYSDGLHQAIEAKESVRVQRESQTLATITFQNYFRMYTKLAGMTGTAATEENEFIKIYNLHVVQVPTAKPMIRQDLPDIVYKTERAKFNAVVEEICQRHATGQPVLVGTVSIERSERLSEMLSRRGVPHQVLNAKHHEREAEIIKLAGQPDAVTIATNMAGRGTDIVLGSGVPELGGLHVLGTERHESRRIDNQLRGRSGRQGDAGSSRFYVSLEDDLMRLFGGEFISGMMDRLGWGEDDPIEHPQLTRAIQRAQEKVEGRNFDIRRQVLEYDDVMNKQREAIYARRDSIMRGTDLRDQAMELLSVVAEGAVAAHADEKLASSEWDLPGLSSEIASILSLRAKPDLSGYVQRSWADLRDGVMGMFQRAYESKEAVVGAERLRELERAIMLYMIDSKWVDHLQAMDMLREGIGLRAYGQMDPLVEYKRESFLMFNDLLKSIGEDFVRYLLRVQVRRAGEPGEEGEGAPSGESPVARADMDGPRRPKYAVTTNREDGGSAKQPQKRDGKKIGRNDPCPCGSGKKYKKCCGVGK
ncbi:MAG: preprotein translocase subunit SecA [Firmicutes bacterium ADurb.BinA052]|nr:MAG: preprotein translocase subunit SecA [Firmicutes bacterium ADurb.BinA052]